jgi:hypothetical protein
MAASSRPGGGAACRRRWPGSSACGLVGGEHGPDPGGSTATGFSVKMCLPAATAAARCAGRKPGGVARITRSIPAARTCSYASKPVKQRSGVTLYAAANAGSAAATLPSCARHSSSRSGITSPSATISMPCEPRTAVARGPRAAPAAPDDPDPDHVRAGNVRAPDIASTAVAAAVVCTNSRRVTPRFALVMASPLPHLSASEPGTRCTIGASLVCADSVPAASVLDTILNPTNGASGSHHRLFGSCGSRSFHDSSWTTRAPGPTARRDRETIRRARRGRRVAGHPFGHVAEQVVQPQGIGAFCPAGCDLPPALPACQASASRRAP